MKLTGIKNRATRAAVGVGLAALLAGGAANALTLTAAYVFYDWTSPGAGELPINPTDLPITFSSSAGYRLNLTGAEATSYGASGSFSIVVSYPLEYDSHTGVIDPGENGGTIDKTYVESEMQIWDDVGQISPDPDTPLNVDAGDNAVVKFTAPPGTYALVIAEDAGLDTFRLDVGGVTYFSGISEGVVNGLLAEGGGDYFGRDDAGTDIDQVWVFLFDGPLTGLVEIFETINLSDGQDFESERLEIDAVLAVVPVPPALLLFGSALVGLTMLGRRYRGSAVAA